MPYKPDPIDRQIVLLLQENGRMPSIEIARRLGNVTERVVRGRIKRMEKEGIIQIKAIVEPARLGLPVTADIWVEVEADQVMEVARKLAQMEHVTYVACATGDLNISIQVSTRDNAELYHFVTDVVGKIPGVIRTTIRILPIILKDIYQWPIPEWITKFSPPKQRSRQIATKPREIYS